MALARHTCCDVYCGARETVGGSSVSSGCWGEDSDHEYGWARRTPTFVAPIRFSTGPQLTPAAIQRVTIPLLKDVTQAVSLRVSIGSSESRLCRFPCGMPLAYRNVPSKTGSAMTNRGEALILERQISVSRRHNARETARPQLQPKVGLRASWPGATNPKQACITA